MVEWISEEQDVAQNNASMVLVQSYLQAIAELAEKDAIIESLEIEKRQIVSQYQKSIQQYHHLKDQYDHQYSQQYQEQFSLPIPCYSWQTEANVGNPQLADFNPAAARFSRNALKQLTLNLGQSPERVFDGAPALGRHLNNCFQSQSSSSQRVQSSPLELSLRVEYVFIHPNQVLMFILDESEQVSTEKQLRQRIRQQSAIAKLGQISISNPDLKKLLIQAVIFAARTLSVSHSSIYVKQNNALTCLLVAGYGWPVDLIDAVTVSSQADSHIGYTFEQQQPITIPDLRLEQRFRGETLLHNYRIVSGVSVIIGSPENPWGALAVYNLEERVFRADEIHYLQAIAHIIASAVERNRQASEMNLLHRSINAISQGIIITDPRQADNPTIYVNEGFEKITGYKPEEILGRNCSFLQGRDRQQEVLVKLRESILKGQSCRVTLRNYRKTGEAFWNDLQIFPVRDESGYLTQFIGVQTDISEQKAAADRLRETEEQFRRTFDLAPIGMAITSLDSSYEQVNQAWCNILGYSAEELLTKNTLDVTHPDDRADDLRLNNILKSGEHSQFQREKRYIAKDGTVIYALMQAVLVRDAAEQPIHIIRQMVDISDRHHMEQQLIHDAFYDNLTGLPNRILLQERLQQSIKHRQRYAEHRFAVLFLDLDHFKWVNDSMGHHVGDLLLQAFAQRVTRCLRETDTLSRLGGDEFVILLDEIQLDEYALYVSQRIHQSLEKPFEIAEQRLYAEVSIGILQNLQEYTSPDAILRDADVAMYQAKSKGRARSEVFDQVLQTQVSTRRYLEQQLREAIAKDRLDIHYQPVVNLETGKLKGFSAQIYWEHEKEGRIDPERCLAIAETSGLIVPLSSWMIMTVWQHLQQWQSQSPAESMLLFFPISAKQLRGGHLVDLMKTIPWHKEISLAQFVFEFNETALSTAEQETRQQLMQLRQLGIHIFLTGFGTPNISINSLYHQLVNGLILEPDLLTHHQNTTNGNFSPDPSSILEAMISLAYSLQLQLLAQGIETKEQWHLLRQLKCPLGQGTLFGDYLSLEQASELLLNHQFKMPSGTKTA